MSDYLGNLAARTLAAPPLRPRVRMRFEPEAAEAAPPPAQIETPVHEQRAAETPRGEQQPPRVIERERLREVAKPGRETTRVVTIEATPPQAPPREPEVIEHVERIETIKPSPVESERLVPSVAKSGRDVRSPRANNDAPRPHRYDEEPPRVAANEPLIRERERLVERRIRIEPELARPETAAEPSVQVSIGRIEIRATTAPPAQRRARGRTAMSIDDYIAKRDAKERR